MKQPEITKLPTGHAIGYPTFTGAVTEMLQREAARHGHNGFFLNKKGDRNGNNRAKR